MTIQIKIDVSDLSQAKIKHKQTDLSCREHNFPTAGSLLDRVLTAKVAEASGKAGLRVGVFRAVGAHDARDGFALRRG